MNELKKFETGKTYIMRFVGDQSIKVYFKVESRTPKTLNLIDLTWHNEKKTCRINILNNIEYCKPAGNYNLAPVLKADKEVFNISLIDVQTVLNDVLEQIKDPQTSKQQIELSLDLALQKSRKLAKMEFEQKYSRHK